jgi:Cdc6-like AAA superfamily ATPase
MFDPSVVPELLESMAQKVGGGALIITSGGAKALADTLRADFSNYLYSAINRTSQVKTLLHRDERVNLFRIYVETFLKADSNIITDDALVERVGKSASVFVVGSAGSGKTMFIRYLFLQLIKSNFGMMPIFVELRGLNSPDYKDDLIQFIYESIVLPGTVVTRDQFDECLHENMFTLILDGLDEVEHDRRPTVEGQIVKLREAYPTMGITIAGLTNAYLCGLSLRYIIFNL